MNECLSGCLPKLNNVVSCAHINLRMSKYILTMGGSTNFLSSELFHVRAKSRYLHLEDIKMATCAQDTVEVGLSERLLEVVQRLCDISPMACEEPTKEFNIRGGGIDVTLKAISSNEAASRTAFVFNEFQIDESHLQCEYLNNGASGAVFEYTIDNLSFPLSSIN